MSRLTSALCLGCLILGALPAPAGQVLVSLTGNWTTTGTTPANTVAAFSASFLIDQNPVPTNSYATSFIVNVTFTMTNGVTLTRSGEAGWYLSSPAATIGLADSVVSQGIDFRARNLAVAGDYLQVVGLLPGDAFTGTTANPALLITDLAVSGLQGFYYPPSPSDYTLLRTETSRYLVEAVGNGDPVGPEVPEPGTAGLVLVASGAAAAMRTEVRQRVSSIIRSLVLN